jgi:DNA repair exonuclease SbcCD ATPase subunit
MNEQNMSLNEEAGSEDTIATDQIMGSTPETTEIIDQDTDSDTETETQEEEVAEDPTLVKLREEKENLLEALRQEREDRRKYKQELEALRPQPHKSAEELEIEKQQEEARAVLKQLGVMTKEDFEQLEQQKREVWEQEQRVTKEREAINQEIESLAKEFDGSNGKPKFDKSKVMDYLEYGSKNKIFNLRTAFQMRHLPEIASYLATKGNKPTNIATQNTVSKSGAMPDLSQMTSEEIWKWQKAQGLGQ